MCKHPSGTRHGVVKFDESFDGIIRNGTVVKYSCEKGWLLNGPQKKKCLDSGLWDPKDKVQCIEIVQ